MKTSITISFFIAILFSFRSNSQHLPPLGSLPMYYNGGFAGEGNQFRFNTGIVTKLSYNTKFTFFGSGDGFIPKIRTGVGASVMQGTNGSMYSVAISPKFSTQGRYTFAPFIDYQHKNYLRYVELEDEFETEYKVPVQENLIRTGILFNSRKLYLGLTFETVHIINYWQLNKIFIQAGYTFQRLPESKFSFTPQVVIEPLRFISGNLLPVVDASLMFRYNKIIWGLNRNGVAIGYQSKKLKMTMSQIYLNGSYRGSLAFRYVI